MIFWKAICVERERVAVGDVAEMSLKIMGNPIVFLFWRMLQSVFLMMEGSDGGITISGLRLMISVRLPLFDSEPGTRRNRTWDETQLNLGRDATEPGTAFAGKFG